jgi:2-iminobutanoate/2-iminopropanoate deaminase
LVELKRFQERMNRVYESFFAGATQPARSCIGVAALTRGALVEMDFIVKESA